jgi:hypothetical protein
LPRVRVGVVEAGHCHAIEGENKGLRRDKGWHDSHCGGALKRTDSGALGSGV